MSEVPSLSTIKVLHTLGPAGTNCELAATEWFRKRDMEPDVRLHPTLEAAVEAMPRDGQHALMGCVVYPDLHEIVFGNREWLELVDCLIVPTDEMLLAQRTRSPISTLATHPAPHRLGPPDAERLFANSNVVAAEMCAKGDASACITTRRAAEALDLEIVENYGAVMMGFTVHSCRVGASSC